MGFLDWLKSLLTPAPPGAPGARPGDSPLRVAARACGAPKRRVAYHLFHNPSPYRTFAIKKRGGGERRIDAPCPGLKAIQRRLARRVLNRQEMGHAAHGFRKRRGIVSNARIHSRQPMLVKLDIKDFFPTITFPRVFGLFRSIGYERGPAGLLARLCTLEGRLPQGAPTSPAISNLICRRLDRRLLGLARKAGARYTRYADDMTFSGPPEIKRLIPRVRRIVTEEGFQLAEDKTRVVRACRQQRVTGLVVNERPNVSRRQRRLLRAILHNAARDGVDAQNRQNLPHFRQWLVGWVQYVRMANRLHGEALIEQMRRIRS